MFKLRREQMEAFRPLVRAQLPHRILADLRSQGVQAQRDEKTGDVVSTDSRGFEARLSFRPDGLPSRLKQPTGATYAFEHDGQGRLAALIVPGGDRLEIDRDPRGNFRELRRPGLLSYGFDYDENDRLRSLRYPDGSTSLFTYTPEGSLESLKDRTGAITHYQQDAKGSLRSIVDPLGRSTTYEADEDGHLSAVIFPDGSRQEYGFDPEARIAFFTTRSGRLVLQDLDEKDRIKSISWGDGTKTDYEYDAAGNVAKAQNKNDKVVLTFNSRGLPLTETTASGTIQYAYDAEDRIIQLTNPFGDVVRYDYDPDGRISLIHDWEGRENHVAYAPDGSIAEIRYANGLTEKQQYARVGRIQRATVVDRRGRILSEQRYDYDLDDRLVATNDFWGDQPSQRSARRLDYDAESRLTTEIDLDSKRKTAQYEYDAKGNLVRDHGTSIDVGLLDEPTRYGNAPIEYDADGNMVRLPGPQGAVHCSFNADGTLATARVNERVIRFEYDAFGRRILKTDGRSSWRFGWAGYQLLWEESQEHPEAPVNRRDYLYYPNGIKPLAFREGGATYWLQTDARDAVVRAFDQGGRVSWRAATDSFGHAKLEVSLVAQPWRLAGQYYDTETGLHYNFSRYYSPWLKSYLSRDPYWFLYDSKNYSYADNDPWNKVDPFGTFWHIVAGAVIGAIVGAVRAAARGENPWAGALDGAILGATIAANPLAFAGWVAAGTVLSLAGQALRGDPISLRCALQEGFEFASDNAGFGRRRGLRQASNRLGIAPTRRRRGRVTNKYGSKGKPDHQARVEKEYRKALGSAKPHERVEREIKIVGHNSRRRPDVQVIDKRTGKTVRIIEVERRPESTYHQRRLAEYRRLGINVETVPLKKTR